VPLLPLAVVTIAVVVDALGSFTMPGAIKLAGWADGTTLWRLVTMNAFSIAAKNAAQDEDATSLFTRMMHRTYQGEQNAIFAIERSGKTLAILSVYRGTPFSKDPKKVPYLHELIAMPNVQFGTAEARHTADMVLGALLHYIGATNLSHYQQYNTNSLGIPHHPFRSVISRYTQNDKLTEVTPTNRHAHRYWKEFTSHIDAYLSYAREISRLRYLRSLRPGDPEREAFEEEHGYPVDEEDLDYGVSLRDSEREESRASGYNYIAWCLNKVFQLDTNRLSRRDRKAKDYIMCFPSSDLLADGDAVARIELEIEDPDDDPHHGGPEEPKWHMAITTSVREGDRYKTVLLYEDRVPYHMDPYDLLLRAGLVTPTAKTQRTIAEQRAMPPTVIHEDSRFMLMLDELPIWMLTSEALEEDHGFGT